MEQMPKWLLLNAQVKRPDGTFDIEKDREATKEYFLGYVNRKTVFFHSLKEKLDYLVENDYYEKEFLEKYEFSDIKKIFEIAYSYKFRFPSYMGAFKFYNDYALKTNDNEEFLERYEDRMSIIALYHSDGDVEKAEKLVRLLMEQTFTPATPTLLNSGRLRRGEFVSCFLLEVGDSLNDISRAVEFGMQLSKRAGGVAFNLSSIRARGEAVKGIENVSKGVVGVMKLLDNAFRYANQLGQRNGSGAAYLNIFHADFEEFLSSRKINADEDIRMKNLSIGVTIPDKFMELAKSNRQMYQFYPDNVKKVFNVDFSEMTANMDYWYDKLANHPDIKKKTVQATAMLAMIAATQAESGYPYLMFIDTVNREHQLEGTIKFSNLCSEILQTSKISSFGDYGTNTDEIGQGISCNLASGHMENMIEKNLIKETIYAAMDIMNSVSEKTDIVGVPEIQKGNNLLRSVGFGMMGHHGFIAKHYIAYGDDEDKDLLNVLFNMVNYYTLKHSNETAKQKGSFHGFENSTYADGSYFDGRGQIFPQTKKVAELFKDIYIPTNEDWVELEESVKTYGLYNAYRMAVAPTGSISYVMSATPSLTPVKELVEERTYGNSKTFYPMPHLENAAFMYETGYVMDKKKLIDTIAVVQQHVDQGISLELNVTSDITTRDLQRYYIYAWAKGIKTLYYTRFHKMSIDECIACAV